MLRSVATLAICAALAPALMASPARLTFIRNVAPPYDLSGMERVAVVYAIGDNEKVSSFVDHFVQYAGRGALRLENAVENNLHLGSFTEKALATLRRDHPADAYIGVSLFSCAGEQRSGEIGETNRAGERVRSKVQWLDVVCSAKLDVRKPDGKRVATFMTHGEGTSPRTESLTDDEREIAYEQAARFAAVNAAESITPRALRETMELDDRAPFFEEATAMLEGDRLADARAIWESALARHRDSAPLQYDLGAICEALGDVRAAEDYLRTAVRLAPAEARYKAELGLLRKRYPTRAK
ncbi:MAG: hypothetical protein QOE68_252 [Thermoanaerobaculia bacterium]|nr:hypothetical protein [Thermoanaerobaculia bacterium]